MTEAKSVNIASELVVREVVALAGQNESLAEEVIAAAVKSWSENTLRAFRSDLELWQCWCRALGIHPAQASASDVACWIRALSGEKPNAESTRRAVGKMRKPATIARYLVHIGTAYRWANLEDPTRHDLVRLEMKAVRRRLGVRQRQARGLRFKGEVADLAEPAKGPCIASLLKACRRDWLGLRDKALLLTAYDTGCRRSELVAIQTHHVEGPDSDGSGLLFIPSSKTDADGQGAHVYLSARAIAAICQWKRAAKIRSGPLFRRVECYSDGSVREIGDSALHPNSITLIYRRLIRDAHAKKLLGPMSDRELQKWLREVSSHSIRVGVAQDNFVAGESLPAIMQAYRWRDPDTVMRYGAKLAAKSGAAARISKKLG